MSCVTINTSKLLGKIRPMNCVNNGPVGLAEDPDRGNFHTYKKLKIPFARTHDSNFFSGYGGPHTIDVGVIFTDFSKDVNDPDAYDFQLTDEYIQKIIAGKTNTKIDSKLDDPKEQEAFEKLKAEIKAITGTDEELDTEESINTAIKFGTAKNNVTASERFIIAVLYSFK